MENELLTKILDKLDKIEKTYVTLNADLINQNIKMSELLNGKLEEPEFEMPETSSNKNGNNDKGNDDNNSPKQKELYYYENNGKIIIHGPGTYDNRPVLKQFGEWNSINKSWDLTIELCTLLEKLPNLIKKEKISLINNE
jgi:hypothetical protein